MKKHLGFLLGSVAALVTLSASQAATVPVSPPATAQSYAELLEPVANAQEALFVDDMARSQQPKPLLQLVQYHHHHHHHHHHNFGGFGFGGFIAPPPVYGYYGGDCYIQRQVVVNRWGHRVIRRVRVCN